MPKQVDIDVQRRAIAKAAIRVIGDVGLGGTRLRDVVRAALATLLMPLLTPLDDVSPSAANS